MGQQGPDRAGHLVGQSYDRDIQPLDLANLRVELANPVPLLAQRVDDPLQLNFSTELR